MQDAGDSKEGAPGAPSLQNRNGSYLTTTIFLVELNEDAFSRIR
jgi:hypothetical protein